MFTCNLHSQIIIDMSNENSMSGTNYLHTGQYYIKDVNNNLNNFTGTWEYISGSNKFQIIMTKVIKYHNIKTNVLLNLNYFEDGIIIQYKKYINNILTYQSSTLNYPTLKTKKGLILNGYMVDYGRLTKTTYSPYFNEVSRQGGEPITPIVKIEKLLTLNTQPKKIKFTMSMPEFITNYDYETYAGQPTFSIPNDVILTKVN